MMESYGNGWVIDIGIYKLLLISCSSMEESVTNEDKEEATLAGLITQNLHKV